MKPKAVEENVNTTQELIKAGALPQIATRPKFASRVGKSIKRRCGQLTKITLRVPRWAKKLNQKSSGHIVEDPDIFISTWDNDPVIVEQTIVNLNLPTQTQELLNKGQTKCRDFVSVDAEHEFKHDKIANAKPILKEKLPFIGELKDPISGSFPTATRSKQKVNRKKARCAQTVRSDGKKCFTHGSLYYTVGAIALLTFLLVIILHHNWLYGVLEPENEDNLRPTSGKTEKLVLSGRASKTVSVMHEGKTIISHGEVNEGIDPGDKKISVGSKNNAEVVLEPSEILKRLNALQKIYIEEPKMLSNISNNPDGIYLSIFPKKHHNWESIKVPSNVHAVDFGGNLNPQNVKDILKQFRSRNLTHIKFSFDNNFCDEFSDYHASKLGPKLDLTLLRGIHFEGGGNCGEIFEFVTYELLVQNIQLLKFSETDVFPNNLGLINDIFQISQGTLEYVYMTGVSMCSECKLFGNFMFPSLKLGVINFKSQVNSPEVADTINRFNSEVSKQCRSINPDQYTLRVEC